MKTVYIVLCLALIGSFALFVRRAKDKLEFAQNSNPNGFHIEGAVPTPKPPPAPDKIKSLHELRGRFPGEWVIQESQNRLTLAGGVPIPIQGHDPRERLRLVDMLEPLLGVGLKDLVESPTPEADSDLSSIYTFDHRLDGHPVFDSYLKMTVRKEDQAVILISSTLKPLSRYESDIRFAQEQAEALIQKWAGFEKIESTKRVIHVDASGIGVNAWQILYQHGGRHSVALISAIDGVVLLNRSAQSHT